MITYKKCQLCGSSKFIIKFRYKKKPKQETDFNINKEKYYREFWECQSCNHMFSVMSFDYRKFYEGKYSIATYGNKMKVIFDKIINLPKKESDNEKRFSFIKKHTDFFFGKEHKPHLLDIGSGIGIFPWRAKKNGWNVTALDPDINHIHHIKANIKIKTLNLDFMNLSTKAKYEIITLNKVLEHIPEPIKMLNKAKNFLKNNGFVYIEVPSVKASIKGPQREEFFIEHLHVFSKKSLLNLIKKSKLFCKKIIFLIEPSGKYTIRAIATKNEFQ